MTDWIVFTAGRPEFLFESGYTVVETYHFGGRLGSAAHVRCDDCPETIRQSDERIRGVEPNVEVTLRTALEFVSDEPADVATIEDVRRLHNVPADSATGAGQTVVAMDSGVDTSHPVFGDASIEQVDVTGSGSGDDVGHGTAVLGQITRLAPEADLIALRIFGDEGRTKTNVIMRAYEWLHNHADEYDVVNMSWGAQQTSEQINRVHERLIRKGVRDVVAAGNSGEKGGSPATAEGAFSVGACTESGEMAEFSSYNPKGDNPDVTAIGKDNRLAQADGTTMGQQLSGPWVKASGTSFSSPEVAGMVAKYLANRPDATPKKILRAFESNARDISGQPRDGAGLVDYAATAKGTSPPTSPPDRGDGHWPRTRVTVEDDAGGDRLELDADWFDSGEYTATQVTDAASGSVIYLEAGGRSDGDGE